MPIPADLWVRLSRLDASCHIIVSSELVHQAGAPPRRLWRVTIKPRADGGMVVDVTGVSTTEALVEALRRAEGLGWPQSLQRADENAGAG